MIGQRLAQGFGQACGLVSLSGWAEYRQFLATNTAEHITAA